MKLTGQIVHGEGRGKILGFPTLNVEGDFTSLKQGVYAVWVELHGNFFQGAMNYGAQPTFDGKKVRVEIFLLDFEGDVYGETLSFEPVHYLRATQHFESPLALKDQIERDVQRVRELLTQQQPLR